MKSRWKRRAVKVSGQSVMVAERVNTQHTRLDTDMIKLRDEWLKDGMHPSLVGRKLRDEFGLNTNKSAHMERRRTLRKKGFACEPST